MDAPQSFRSLEALVRDDYASGGARRGISGVSAQGETAAEATSTAEQTYATNRGANLDKGATEETLSVPSANNVRVQGGHEVS